MWEYTVHDDRGGEPRWWLADGAGTNQAYSGESFDSDSNATRAAEHFKANASAWDYDVFQGDNGLWYWHARANNNANVASSGRSYPTQAEAQTSADAVKVNGGGASGP
jgi:uncharacterized protein